VDCHPDLLLQSEIVTVIPDLRHLPVLESKEIGGREGDPSPAWLEPGPGSEVRSGRRPAPDDEVALGDDQIDGRPEIGEGGAKVVGDPLLTRRPRQRVGRPEIMANVILGEDLIREVGIASVPDLL
jgi:hypothetical protein